MLQGTKDRKRLEASFDVLKLLVRVEGVESVENGHVYSIRREMLIPPKLPRLIVGQTQSMAD